MNKEQICAFYSVLQALVKLIQPNVEETSNKF